MGRGEYAFDAKRRHGAGGTGGLSPPATSSINKNQIAVPSLQPGLSLQTGPSLQSTRWHTPKPDICPTIGFMADYGIAVSRLEAATLEAGFSGQRAAEELIRSGAIGRELFAELTARFHNIGFSPTGPSPNQLTGQAGISINLKHSNCETIADDAEFFGIVTEYRGWHEKPGIHVACDPAASSAIEKLVLHSKINRSQVTLTTKKALNYCQFVAGSKRHSKNAVSSLTKLNPEQSASRVITKNQTLAILLLMICIIVAGWFWFVQALLALHLIASLFYFSVTIMRAAMIVPGAEILSKKTDAPFLSPHRKNELPTYTLMIAVYKEAGQIAHLVQSLKQLDWPKDRLQVLLICEADDPDTIFQCQQYCGDERFQTVICPVSSPRTKPKALNFALPLARGEFLVLYDAEDRPHRDQLREAHAKFLQHPETACLQAPLSIHNDTQSWFSRMFAIEYVTQFSLILPVLEKWKSPIPLGGTSNHFRTKILREIGAWDPYNVTEDADLGIRLARFGYHCGTLKLATLEEAPPVLGVWFKQRTRWIKGWLQTLLVHTRHPVKLGQDLGLAKTILFHLVITSIVVSVLIHPFFIASAVYHVIILSGDMRMSMPGAGLLGIDVFNLVGGYSTYFAICWLALEAGQKHYLKRSIIWLPAYWLLISMAGWRAVWQLFRDPFLWEKTRHGFFVKKQDLRHS